MNTSEKVYIVCYDRAYLAPIKTMGPIMNPISVTKGQAAQMVLNGSKVAMYLPAPEKKYVQLTNDNFKAILDGKVEAPKAAPVATSPSTPIGVTVAAVVEEAAVETADTTEAEEETTPSAPLSNSNSNIPEFVFNEDGTVNESDIDWTSMSNNLKKTVRKKINELNKAATAE